MGCGVFKYLIFLYIISSTTSDDQCPSKCTCSWNRQKDGPDWLRVRCGDLVKFSHLDELNVSSIANKIVQLNLSNNHLTEFAPKIQFLALQKLDISKNQLTIINNSQFNELPNLKRLDLSGNNIKLIETSAFVNLQQLERLKLSHNAISTITKGTFKSLVALKQLDISNNPLTCDCELLWLLEWAQTYSIKLVSNPKCSAPVTFNGIALRKLKIGVDIHCKSPAGNREPFIHLQPDKNQVVFEGDFFKIQCRTPSVSDDNDPSDTLENTQIRWMWQDLDPNQHFSNIKVENRYLPEDNLIESTLTIKKLNRNNTGLWKCQHTRENDFFKGVTVIVISDDTRYCPITTTVNNKGSYMWPRTIVNYTATTACESVNINNDISQQRVSHFCSESGLWGTLNTSACSYVSDATKILEQFSKVDLNLTKTNLYESAERFRNYTSNLKIFKDPMDLVYVVKTIENYIQLISADKELGSLLLDVLNKLLDLPKKILLEAEVKHQSCKKIVKTVENIAVSALSSKVNIAGEEFSIKQDAFKGVTCMWFVNPANKTDRSFYCMSSNQSPLLNTKNRVIEASVQIPASLFYHLQEQDIYIDTNIQRLHVAMFSNSKLFPVKDEKIKKEVTSTVVGVQLGNITVTNLTEPIYIMLHIPMTYSYEEALPTPVWWNASLNNGNGNWSTSGCTLSREVQDSLIFYCKQLGYYGLLQDVTHLEYFKTGARFRFSHPAIYVGSFILFVSLLIVIITYILCYVSIQMPKKGKHSLVNMWIAVEFLIFVYMFGIHQTEDTQICQVVGLLLHYFTLSSLLWMCVGVSTMYKRLNKPNSIELQDDELPSDQPVQKPILGLYLVGWGIALIICGISGAVNMKEYSAQHYCFLNSAPALSALFIPSAILVVCLGALFLLIRCAIYNSDANGHLSEGTQATENVDLDLLEPSFPNPERVSVHSSSMKTRSSEIEDSEHAPATQLRAYIIFLILYSLLWFTCAIATSQPFTLQYEEDIFSIAYAILATTLGAFTLFFYCVARHDIRNKWLLFRSCVRRKGSCYRSRNISDTTHIIPQIQIQPLPLPPISNAIAAETQLVSRSSSRSSNNTKSNSNHSNVLKAAKNLNSSTLEEPPGAKINNVNLVVLHRQQYRSNNVVPNLIENPANGAQIFYNPYQSTVARKFFKRQRQNMMKRNNLHLRKCDGNSDTTSVTSYVKHNRNDSSMERNMLGTNSKVNNTNIHVEHVRKAKHRNPNILSASREGIDSINAIPINKLMLNAECLRKRETTRHKPKKKQNVSNAVKVEVIEESQMRTVSQQCSLDYSSDTSALDKSLDSEKCNLPNFMLVADNNTVHHQNNTLGISATGSENDHCSNILMNSEQKFCTDTEVDKLSCTTGSTDFANKHILASDTEPFDLNRAVPTIYVNPSHDLHFPKRVQSRASSVSASELDELYQQIRRGPRKRLSHSRKHMSSSSIYREAQNVSPHLSDSDFNFYVSDIRLKSRTIVSADNASDNVETTV